jgi:hypothetical protein
MIYHHTKFHMPSYNDSLVEMFMAKNWWNMHENMPLKTAEYDQKNSKYNFTYEI